MPRTTAAMGKAYLCGPPTHAHRGQLAEDQGRHRTKLQDCQDRGFCLSSGLWDANIGAVGVPRLVQMVRNVEASMDRHSDRFKPTTWIRWRQ
jgi:hypothetical protein